MAAQTIGSLPFEARLAAHTPKGHRLREVRPGLYACVTCEVNLSNPCTCCGADAVASWQGLGYCGEHALSVLGNKAVHGLARLEALT